MREASPLESGDEELARRVILVVEDDSRTLRLVRFILEEEGFEVEEAGNGADGLKILREASLSLVLIDIGLPDMDGFALCQQIRGASGVPIIIVTAKDKDEDIVRGLELGADDYVTKPFSTTELTARVKAVLRRHDSTTILGDPVPNVTSQSGRGTATPAPTPVMASSCEGPSSLPSQASNPDMYEGTVRLVVETAGSIRNMIRFVDELRQNSQFHLLRLVANQHKEVKQGMDILLRLREPILLKETLQQLADVSAVEEPAEPSPAGDERSLLVFLSE